MFVENLKQLNKYDQVYIIDCLNKNSKKFISEKNLENKLVIFRQISLNDTDKNFLKEKNINYKIFTWQSFNKNIYLMWLSHKISYKESNNLYNFFFKKNSIHINFLLKLYNDQKIKDAFKKYLIDISQDYYDLKILLKVLLRFNKNIKCFIFKDTNKSIFNYDRAKNEIKNIVTITSKNFPIKRIFTLIFYPIFLSLFRKKYKSKIKKKDFNIGFRIYSNGFAFKDYGNLDWLIEEDKKLTEQSLFVLEDNLKERNIDKFNSLIEKKYNYCSANYWLQSDIEIKSILKNFLLFLKSIFVNLKLFSKNNELILNFYFEGYINYFIWNNFCENYNLQNYVCYHNYQFQHYFRNSILNKNNCKTIHYKATNSENIFNFKISKKYNNSRMALFNYDVEFHQTLQSIEMSKQNISNSKKFVISGPTFISKSIQNKNIFDEKKFKILMFNSSYNSYTAVNGIEGHYKFLTLVEKILENKNNVVYFKTKKNYEIYYSIENKVKILAKKLFEKENFKVLDGFYPNNLIIEKSDLAISMAFASPLIYSIYKKKYFIYCDLLNQYPNSYFKNYENICVDNIDKVIQLISLYSLNKIDKNKYNQLYLDCFGKDNLKNSKKLIELELD
jgi:polysaccharide biosynthesis PFTS motif protein